MSANLEKLITGQRDFFSSSRTKDIGFRIEQLKTLEKAIKANEKNILEALKRDLSKPEFESYAPEIGFVLNEIKYASKNVLRWSKAERVRTPLLQFPASSYIYSESLGNVLIIGPWNYPFQLIMAPLVGSIAAGNCSILKPSEFAPASSKLIARLVEQNFDPGYLSAVEGGSDIAKKLLEHKFDHIFFTGSADTGRLVYSAAAKNLTPITLELGGKSPCIVDKNINIEYSAKRIIWGKFFNAGQTCIAPDYLLAHSSVKKMLLDSMAEYVKKFYEKTPGDYAGIINQAHFERLSGLLEGNIVVGGKTNISNLYISPTIITDVSWEDKIMQNEIFGPILPVLEYINLDEAIAKINKNPKPLAIYIFSNDKEVQDKILRGTSSGGVCINDCLSHISSEHLPFGGIGGSGIGNYHGKFSFDTFSHKKSVMKKSFRLDIPLRYPPYSQAALRLLKKIYPL